MRFICCDCKEIFDEEDADEMEADLEVMNGVGGIFEDHHTTVIYICPECGSEDLDVYDAHEEGEDDETD